MANVINDKDLITELSGKTVEKIIKEKLEKEKLKKDFNLFPLNTDIIGQLKSLISKTDNIEYFQLSEVEGLWLDLIDKSIQCLRYFDTREPFTGLSDSKENFKIPVTYGLDRIKQYQYKYSDFEKLLYGASSYYRDHIFHSVRTWLLGIFCLLRKSCAENKLFIDEIDLDGLGRNDFAEKINFFEKLSIWTVAALCHDLGYPLEKSRKILDKTKNMMREFVPNPSIFDNFNFTGIQDNINDFIIRFLSTKMVEVSKTEENEKENRYNGRIQPKYYLKYSKSLENFDHGIISAVIIYKMLLYFLESDFNMNDDYVYKLEDARQFYIRREILRPMASHTCSDVYNIHLNTFSSLLFICDELQEWGRKSWSELYTGLNSNSISLKIADFSVNKVSVEETVDMKDVDDKNIIFENIKKIIERQYLKYKMIFRDGQYTDERKFDFHKSIRFECKRNSTNENYILINYELNASKNNKFFADFTNCSSYEEFKEPLNHYISKIGFKSEFEFKPKCDSADDD